MGLDVNGTRFLLFASRRGVSFDKTLTIGRQQLLCTEQDLKKNFSLFGSELPLREIREILTSSDGFGEGLLKRLGAQEIQSMDASEYEDASVVHDLNTPVPEELKGRFSVVIDGGTLEHIFNFPTAIKNCMEMVAPGGHFLGITPCNNYMGHGFYQFSPELFYRIFSEENGFEIKELMVFEETENSPWYSVIDPKTAGERVTLINAQPTMMLVIAEKIRKTPLFQRPPQQSDYLAAWSESPTKPLSESKRLGWLPLRDVFRIPLVQARRLGVGIQRTRGMLKRGKRHFKRISIE